MDVVPSLSPEKHIKRIIRGTNYIQMNVKIAFKQMDRDVQKNINNKYYIQNRICCITVAITLMKVYRYAGKVLRREKKKCTRIKGAKLHVED